MAFKLKEKELAYYRAWQKSDRIKNPDRYKAYYKKSYYKRHEKCKLYAREKARNIREIVMNHYGAICVCCGETNKYFLSIDHINNDGHWHRKENKLAIGIATHRWIVKNNFPKTIRILCMNCNFGRAKTPDKRCPHEIEVVKILKVA